MADKRKIAQVDTAAKPGPDGILEGCVLATCDQAHLVQLPAAAFRRKDVPTCWSPLCDNAELRPVTRATAERVQQQARTREAMRRAS
ncbi:MAG: hypothetical protein Q8K63_15900 [Acidimicrobiales bacterium]|nr:hypothetical protein [Acidimicrobiales bacterium]